MDLPPDAVPVATVDGVPIQWRTATDHYTLTDGELTVRPLTEEELAAMAEKAALVAAEEARIILTDREKIAASIAALTTQTENLSAVIGALNADINASPASYIKATARAARRTANQTIRTLRLLGGVLDTTDLGTE